MERTARFALFRARRRRYRARDYDGNDKMTWIRLMASLSSERYKRWSR